MASRLVKYSQHNTKHLSSESKSSEPFNRSDPRSYQSRLKCGTSSRLLELRNKVGFGGILSSISERELAGDRLSGDGMASNNVVTFSQASVARRSRDGTASRGPTSFKECAMALAGFDAFGVDVPQVR